MNVSPILRNTELTTPQDLPVRNTSDVGLSVTDSQNQSNSQPETFYYLFPVLGILICMTIFVTFYQFVKKRSSLFEDQGVDIVESGIELTPFDSRYKSIPRKRSFQGSLFGALSKTESAMSKANLENLSHF